MNIFKKALKLIFIQLPLVPFVAAAATASSSAPGIDLSITSLFGILSGLACWMSRFVIIIMTIVIIWYGLQFLLSRGNPKAFEDAKQERLDNGIAVRAYGHNSDNDKKVVLVTAIMDTAKAFAYYKSDMLKKRRAESGVIGEPERFLYRVVQRY